MNQEPRNFGLIGVAGYIAVRHLRAIKETGNLLLASLDRFDSVGIIDSFFPESDFFVEFERYDRHFEKLKRNGIKVDYVSICSPNYLHDAHIRFSLRHKADAICEKPVVLNPWNIDALQEIEKETGRRVYTILQLRHHPEIIKLRERILKGPRDKVYNIDLTYITGRGNWYYISWKGDIQKSGGVATNIGVHFFAMLGLIFGNTLRNRDHMLEHNKAAGYMELDNARTYRSVSVDGEEFEFSDGFTELHTITYREILSGRGYGLEDSRQSVETVYAIRNSRPSPIKGEYHPFIKKFAK
jgi:UDP-N-acetyl-2-amino-2-deoxyglucuronate dehydrogenase